MDLVIGRDVNTGFRLLKTGLKPIFSFNGFIEIYISSQLNLAIYGFFAGYI